MGDGTGVKLYPNIIAEVPANCDIVILCQAPPPRTRAPVGERPWAQQWRGKPIAPP